MTEINETVTNSENETLDNVPVDETLDDSNDSEETENETLDGSNDTEEYDYQEIPEQETVPLPWADAPENTIYYDKIYEDGHLGSFTESPEMAYKFGWYENRISKDDVKQSDVNGWTYRKEVCPIKSDEAKLQDAKERKHTELRNARDQLRYTEFAHYDNDDFQIRPEDQDNINTFYSSALAMKLGAIENNGFGLMSETNTLHYFTADQIIELMAVMKAKVEEIYQRYWYARDELLENATTIEEVESIVIPSSL